jgi:hypothetical protein
MLAVNNNAHAPTDHDHSEQEAAWREHCTASTAPVTAALFGEIDQPVPEPTTAPLFTAISPHAAPTGRAAGLIAQPAASHPSGDVALFATVLNMPTEHGPAGPLAFEFGLDWHPNP